MYLEAVKTNAWAITDIPYKFITEEMCRIAVSRDGSLIKNLPKKYITNELCLIAV